MSRARSLVLRLLIVALLIGAAVWVSLRAYGEYEAHRAMSMLAEASRVQIGDTEISVLMLVKRYGGYKWTPGPLSPRENWVDKDEYDYQRNLVADYRYNLEVSPFGLLTTDGHMQGSRVTRAIRTAINAAPARLRAILGMRDWGTAVDLSIQGGHVQSVSGMTLVEGRSEWLGHEWRFANAMPHHDMQARVFVIDSAILEMENGGGTAIESLLTPGASAQEVQLARKFNAACLNSISGCDGLCDVAPRALEYLKQHPEAAGNIIAPECH